MNTRHMLVVHCALLLAMLPVVAVPQEVLDAVYTVPTTDKDVMPHYPDIELQQGQEAVVHVNFMVDQDGKVFDAMVSRSTGSRSFDQAALRALNRTRFEPARLDGVAIVGSASYKYVFTIPDNDGASTGFVRDYRKFQKALQKSEQEGGKDELQKQIDALQLRQKRGGSNHYENAFLNLAQYQFAERYGTALEQMQYLHGALSWSDSTDDPVYFDKQEVIEMRRSLLMLQLRNKYFGEAEDTYALLQESGDAEAEKLFGEAMQEAQRLKQDDREYGLPLVLEDDGSVWLRLFKHRIAFLVDEGRLDEVKLRCERNRVAFAVEAEAQYEIPKDWGRCSLQVMGTPQARFTLVQN